MGCDRGGGKVGVECTNVGLGALQKGIQHGVWSKASRFCGFAVNFSLPNAGGSLYELRPIAGRLFPANSSAWLSLCLSDFPNGHPVGVNNPEGTRFRGVVQW
jgi:hypothetical protein